MALSPSSMALLLCEFPDGVKKRSREAIERPVNLTFKSKEHKQCEEVEWFPARLAIGEYEVYPRSAMLADLIKTTTATTTKTTNGVTSSTFAAGRGS